MDQPWTSAPTLGDRVKALVDEGDRSALRAALELVYDAIDALDSGPLARTLEGMKWRG